MKISLTNLVTCIYCYLMSALFCVLLTNACAYIYSCGATYQDISGLLIGYKLHHGGCVICTDLDIILYSQHPPSNKKEI